MFIRILRTKTDRRRAVRLLLQQHGRLLYRGSGAQLLKCSDGELFYSSDLLLCYPWLHVLSRADIPLQKLYSLTGCRSYRLCVCVTESFGNMDRQTDRQWQRRLDMSPVTHRQYTADLAVDQWRIQWRQWGNCPPALLRHFCESDAVI